MRPPRYHVKSSRGAEKAPERCVLDSSICVFFVVQDPDAASKEPRQFTPEVRVMAGARPMHAEFCICVLLDAGGKTYVQNLIPGSDKSECDPRLICTPDPSNCLVGSFADARVWCFVHGSKISACHAHMYLAAPAHGADSPWIRVSHSIGRHFHGCPCQ
jgi:hypothetical protein